MFLSRLNELNRPENATGVCRGQPQTVRYSVQVFLLSFLSRISLFFYCYVREVAISRFSLIAQESRFYCNLVVLINRAEHFVMLLSLNLIELNYGLYNIACHVFEEMHVCVYYNFTNKSENSYFDGTITVEHLHFQLIFSSSLGRFSQQYHLYIAEQRANSIRATQNCNILYA